jgi:NitT/TauT family transport system permease protein
MKANTRDEIGAETGAGANPERSRVNSRWTKLRATLLILATQVALLALLLFFWERATATDKQAAFMFGSPSAILGFLAQMSREEACGAIPTSPGLKRCSALPSETFSAR